MTAKVDEDHIQSGSWARTRRRWTVLATAAVALAATLAFLLTRESEPPPPPPPASWSGDFDTGDLGQYNLVQEASPDRIELVGEPSREGPFAARLTAWNGDLQGGDNPRAQLVSGLIHRPGAEEYIGWSTYFPSDFPAIGGPDPFFVFFQFHGPPFDGSPPLGFGVGTDGRLALSRSATYNFDTIWTAPLPKGRWVDFVAHVKWSKEEDGFLELWLDGRRQTFSVNGHQRLQMQTIEDDQDALATIPTNYRRLGSAPGPVTIYHDEVKVGTSYAAVVPTGAPQPLTE